MKNVTKLAEGQKVEVNIVPAPEPIRSAYERMAAINVNDKLEKKNGLSYLSWAWAVDQLMRADPDAFWEYHPPVTYGDTMMVFCTVHAFGRRRTMQLPVMDHRNRAIPNPDAFAVNTAMQRCLVKAIALHGLGLYVYAGEDLPPDESGDKAEAPKKPPLSNGPIPANIEGQTILANMDSESRMMLDEVATTATRLAHEGKDAYGYVESHGYDHETKLALWAMLASDVRAAIKKQKPKEAMASQP